MDLGILIPIFALLIPIVAIWTRHQQKMAELEPHRAADGDPRETSRLTGRVQELEERVRVLERIVTDSNSGSGSNLAAEIEALRTSTTDTGVPLGNMKERV